MTTKVWAKTDLRNCFDWDNYKQIFINLRPNKMNNLFYQQTEQTAFKESLGPSKRQSKMKQKGQLKKKMLEEI